MEEQGLCCRYLNDVRDSPSPFGHIIGLDWYDGFLSGFAECGKCGVAYWFSVVAWDYASPRIYALMPLEDSQFDRVLRSLDSLEDHERPIWMPIWNFPDPAQQLLAEREIDEKTASAGAPRYLIKADVWSLRIIYARELKGDEEIAAVRAVLRENEDAWPYSDRWPEWLAFLHRTPE